LNRKHEIDPAADKPPENLRAALGKVLPFWMATMAVAILTIILINAGGIRIINYIEYPETSPADLLEAYRAEGEKNYREAAAEFEKLKNDPDRETKMKGLDSLAKAKRLFQESLRINPKARGIHEMLADLHVFQGDPAGAAYHDGMSMLLDGRQQEALFLFDEALNTDPRRQDALEQKIRVLIETSRFDEARSGLDSLFAMESGAEAWHLKGVLAMRTGEAAIGAASMEKALELDPGHIEAGIALSRVAEQAGDHVRAAVILSGVHKAHPMNANILHRLGRAQIAHGDLAGARQSLESALKIEKNSAPLYLDLAGLYEKMGRKSRADLMIRRALERDPSLRQSILRGTPRSGSSR